MTDDQVDDVLADDAEGHPAFAKARERAVRVALDGNEQAVWYKPDWIRGVCSILRAYEDSRGNEREPAPAAARALGALVASHIVAAYESGRVA